MRHRVALFHRSRRTRGGARGDRAREEQRQPESQRSACARDALRGTDTGCSRAAYAKACRQIVCPTNNQSTPDFRGTKCTGSRSSRR